MLTRDYKRICMWGVPRSGSTYVFYNLVEHILNSGWNKKFNTDFNIHHKGSEPFRQDVVSRVEEFEQEECWIAKVHNVDMRNLKEAGVYKRFECMPDYNILLLRKNLFDSALSLCIASIKQQWTNEHDTKPIKISVDKFNEMLGHQIEYQDSYNDMTFDTTIYTEDLTNDPNDIWNMLTGTQPKHSITNSISKSPNKQQVVINYKELRSIYNEMRISK